MFFRNNCFEGAETSIYLASSPEVKDVTGKYFVDCKVKDFLRLIRVNCAGDKEQRSYLQRRRCKEALGT